MPMIDFKKARNATRSNHSNSKIFTSNTAIRKGVNAADRFGNPGIKNQQWTTIELYDYLPYAPGTTLTFFENVGTRAFPLTNLTENKLQVGEMLVLKRVWFTVATVDTGVITTVSTFEQASLSGQYLSQFAWFNNNNRVIKPISLTNMQAEFNRKGWSTDNNVLHLETDITLQTLVSFTAQLRMVPGAAVENTLIGCHVAGLGTILSPKGTY